MCCSLQVSVLGSHRSDSAGMDARAGGHREPCPKPHLVYLGSFPSPEKPPPTSPSSALGAHPLNTSGQLLGVAFSLTPWDPHEGCHWPTWPRALAGARSIPPSSSCFLPSPPGTRARDPGPAVATACAHGRRTARPAPAGAGLLHSAPRCSHGSGAAAPKRLVRASYYVPPKPQGEFGRADCNYLPWRRPSTPAPAPFPKRFRAGTAQKRGPESQGQHLAVVPLVKGRPRVPSAVPGGEHGPELPTHPSKLCR